VSIIGAAAHSSDKPNPRGQEIKASRERHNKIEKGKKNKKIKKKAKSDIMHNDKLNKLCTWLFGIIPKSQRSIYFSI
jgi:hypothetical protein